jgi:threonine synthase
VNFVSTRGSTKYSFEDVLTKGIADDGGLFIPTKLPKFNSTDFHQDLCLQSIARRFLLPFFESSSLERDINEIVDEAFSFPIPTENISSGYSIMELFHGPTAAFKDVGAGFLASCLSRLNANQSSPLIVLVATSGDTGGAVAAAFDELPNVRVVVLFPEGKVSKRQEKQLTCWGNNILSLSVKGTFDDCQKIVKEAFIDSELTNDYRFSSANSINFGRLLPQSVYYAYSSLKHFRAMGVKPNYIIPTGNLGNGLACILARDMGLPIGDIVLTVNENKLIVDYLMGEGWEPKKSIETLANAMDVGNPSNMERLNSLYGDVKNLNKCIRAITVSDNMIKQEIKRSFEKEQLILCPHTATATHAYHHLSVANKENKDWIIVATAHPAKFETVVEPLIACDVPIPVELAAILDKPSQMQKINASMSEFKDILNNNLN